MKTVLKIVCVCVFAISLFCRAAVAGEFVPVVDADWPVARKADEATLKKKADRLEALVKKIDAAKLDSSYARSTLVLARDFITYAAQDDKNGRPGRARYVRGYLDEALDAAATDAEALLANPKLNKPVPRPKLGNISIEDGGFFADGTNLMLGGMGHFSQVRADIPKFPDYGFNLIQIEIGPNSVVKGPGAGDISTGAITGDIIKQLDAAEKSNIAVNLLLSPHYFPQWAMDAHPELKQCGRGFIKYCVSEPAAREVIRRFLETLIPMIKDKPALQSYTLANEPEFDERSEANVAKFRAWLEKKYGSVAGLNRAWRKSYSGFERVKVGEDLFSVNTAARLDWSMFHYEIGTDFFAWMTKVIRSMDPVTPVHIKFMDGMFRNDETTWGIDREALGKITDISGNDSSINYPGSGGYGMNYQKNAAFFDFLKSVQPDKPVQNSETHIIRDDDPLFYPGEYVYAALMIQYLHGMGASTMWVWERGDGFTLGNNVLSRPNCAAAAARATLDARRLAPWINALANAQRGIAIYYSNTSRTTQVDFESKWNAAYELALYSGYPVRMVTDSMLIGNRYLWDEYPLMVVPEYLFTTDELYRAVIEYVRNGGRVVAIGNPFGVDPSKRKRDTAEWAALEYPKVLSTDSAGYVYPLKSSGKATAAENLAAFAEFLKLAEPDIQPPVLRVAAPDGSPVLGIEYRSVEMKSGKRAGYVMNALDRPVKIAMLADGKALSPKDLISGRALSSEVEIKPYEIFIFEF